MATIESAGTIAGVGSGILDREHTIAKAGFNRWLLPPAALCIRLCIGMAYGFSVFWLPLARAIGLTAPKTVPDISLVPELFTATFDWRVASTGPMYTLFFVLPGVSRATFGRGLQHMEHKQRSSEHIVRLENAPKSRQFWVVWAVICLNVSAGIGVIGMASPMLQEIFAGKLIGLPNLSFSQLSAARQTLIAGIAAGFTSLMSLFNIGGRFFLTSLSGYIVRNNTHYCF